MKLINDKKFLEDLRKEDLDFDIYNSKPSIEDIMISGKSIKEILSKHLKDLPNKLKPTNKEDALAFGYNECLKDCEDK